MIRKALPSDLHSIARLALELWPANAFDELTDEFSELLDCSGCAVFLALYGDSPVGFAQCQLRSDYVEGTETSPVDYLEGIYVRPDFRHRGIARELLRACEGWAESLGCAEFASDCELDNNASLLFHLKMGFIEANRIICFTKQLAKE